MSDKMKRAHISVPFSFPLLQLAAVIDSHISRPIKHRVYNTARVSLIFYSEIWEVTIHDRDLGGNEENRL